MGINWDNSPLFWGEYYSDTPFMLSPISPGSPNVSYTMPQRYGFLEDLYGLKGLEFCQNPTSCFFVLCVYYISVMRQTCWIGPPEYVSNRI
eukprot:COSAG01_NODE_54634_length_330_cov_14.632035_1_plen_91_part_10